VLRSYLSPVARRVGQLESVRATAGRCRWSIEEQAQVCRNLLMLCSWGAVERTPDGYRAITDDSSYGQPFEIEPGRWDKRGKILPELAEEFVRTAEFLTELFKRTGKYFPVYKGIALLQDPEFVAAVYRHYGARIFDE
jgi:hypothetical protein